MTTNLKGAWDLSRPSSMYFFSVLKYCTNIYLLLSRPHVCPTPTTSSCHHATTTHHPQHHLDVACLLQHQCYLIVTLTGAWDTLCLEPQVRFFFLSRYVFFFYYTNEYQWFKFSWTYVWTWQRQQGRGKGSRCVTTCLICLFSFYVLFTILTSIWISYAYKWTQQGRGKGLRPHLIMWRGWCYDFKWL